MEKGIKVFQTWMSFTVVTSLINSADHAKTHAKCTEQLHDQCFSCQCVRVCVQENKGCNIRWPSHSTQTLISRCSIPTHCYIYLPILTTVLINFLQSGRLCERALLDGLKRALMLMTARFKLQSRERMRSLIIQQVFGNTSSNSCIGFMSAL